MGGPGTGGHRAPNRKSLLCLPLSLTLVLCIRPLLSPAQHSALHLLLNALQHIQPSPPPPSPASTSLFPKCFGQANPNPLFS